MIILQYTQVFPVGQQQLPGAVSGSENSKGVKAKTPSRLQSQSKLPHRFNNISFNQDLCSPYLLGRTWGGARPSILGKVRQLLQITGGGGGAAWGRSE